MKKLLALFFISLSLGSFAQSNLTNNAVFNLKDSRNTNVYRFAYLNNTDSIATMDSVGLRVIRPMRFKGRTTAQRPAFAVEGMMGYNTDSLKLEYYDGAAWQSLGTSTATTYSSGSGLTLTAGQFKLGGSLSENLSLNTTGAYTVSFTDGTTPMIYIDANERVSIKGTNNGGYDFFINGQFGASSGTGSLYFNGATNLTYSAGSASATWRIQGNSKYFVHNVGTNGYLFYPSTDNTLEYKIQEVGGANIFGIDFANKKVKLHAVPASSSPYSILFKQSDSSVSQLAFTGSTSDYLRADGTFATPPGGSGLPSQTGNAGKYLTTDGTNASWATVSGGGATDLSASYSASDVTVASSTGLDATINAATTSNAGVMSAAMKVKLDSTITSITLSQDSITVFKRADGTEAFRDTLTTFYFTKSIVEVGGNQAQLVNDETSPGNNEYYGTDGSGTKGFFANVDNMTDYHAALEALGSTHKAQTVGFPLQYCNTSSGLTDNQIRYTAVYLNKAQTLTGVKVYVRTAGNYTGDQTNAVALYSYSGGTMTKVAESANTATLWTSAANAIQTIAFSSTYAAQPGIYYVGILYNNSAQTTAPALATGTALNNLAMASLDFTNSAKLYGTVNTQNSFPATQAMSGVTGATAPTWVAVY